MLQEIPLNPKLLNPKLLGFGELLKKSFEVYKERFWQLMGLSVLKFLAGFFLYLSFFVVFFGFLIRDPIRFLPFFLLMLVVFFVFLTLFFWMEASLIFIIKEREKKIGVLEALKLGWSKTFSLLWVTLLTAFAISVGTLPFIIASIIFKYWLDFPDFVAFPIALPFFIPAIIFIVWFVFSPYVLISEDLKGMKALWKSQSLGKGYWWGVFERLFVITGAALLISDFLLKHISLINTMFWILISPFILTFGFLLYEDLKRLKERF